MKYLLSILKRTSINRIQYHRLLSSSGNNYNQLPTSCDPQSDVYKVFSLIIRAKGNLIVFYQSNYEAMTKTVTELKTTIQRITLGGTAEARKRHTSKNKLLARDRVDKLLDPKFVVIFF